MASLIFKSTSTSEIELILILAKKLGIEAQKINDAKSNHLSGNSKKVRLVHNFFDSIGLWQNRNIDAKTLRNEACKILE